ncbi:MAG: hypothetical protein ACRDSR_00755 [Pseudonocardiaceae bacterium]
MRSEAVVVETTRYVRWEQMRALVAEVLEMKQEIGGVDGVERVTLFERLITDRLREEVFRHAQ